MNDLIERIEAASRGSRALDWEIHVHDGIDGKGMYGPHPRYSFSIDAALTLVPEGFEWSLEYQAGHHVSSDVECMVAIAKLGDPCFDWEATSATPALALCAAALKARAYLKETNNGQ
jgi:hypothetical protein